MNTSNPKRFNSFVTLGIVIGFLTSSISTGFAAGGGGGGGGGGGFGGVSQSEPKFDPVVKYQEGVAALNAGENKKAERAFKKVLTVAKKDANINYPIGYLSNSSRQAQ